MAAEEVFNKVVTIYGQSLDPREMNAEVVARLEDALERARSGEIIAMGLALMNYDGSTGHMTAGHAGHSSMVGAAFLLLSSISR